MARVDDPEIPRIPDGRPPQPRPCNLFLLSNRLRSCTLFAVVATLLVLAAAQDMDTKGHEETQPSPLTAIQLPSESIFRAARTAVRAARALADNIPSESQLASASPLRRGPHAF